MRRARFTWPTLALAASCHGPSATAPPRPAASTSASASAAPSPRAHEPDPLREAQAYWEGRPVAPVDDDMVIVEAEELRPEGEGFRPLPFGTNYYASTFANCFLSRKAYLGAAEHGPRAVASIEVKLPAKGRYLALARYEAAYRFHTQFRLQIDQGGARKLDRLYGARDNLRVYAFRQGLQREIAWGWGATETIVWEGHDAEVELDEGVARVTLIADEQPEPAARRNIDAIVLTRDREDVEKRIAKEQYLPLDGLLTQRGDVFLRVANQAASTAFALTVPPGQEHSPYWVHLRDWKKLTLSVASGEITGWTEVGHLLDTLNDGQWQLTAEAKGPVRYDVEIGVRAPDGRIEPIRRFEGNTGDLELGYFANTRHARRIVRSDEVLYELLSTLRGEPVVGRPLQQTLFYAYTFAPRPKDAAYQDALGELLRLMGGTALDDDDPRHLMLAESPPRGMIDVREVATKDLETYAKKLVADGKADHVAVVSLGDEIGLPRPTAADEDAFRAWLKAQKLKPRDVDPAAGDDWKKVEWKPGDAVAKTKPALRWYGEKWAYRFGIARLAERTAILRRYLPHAAIGANFSPHHGHPYLGSTHQWISLFREDGMTMPWSEDYIFMSPVGSPQNNMLVVDMLRAGIRGKPGAKIHYYVMPHAPNNTPSAWRRQLYGDIAHGVKIFNLFELRPVQAAYTENYVNAPEMYREIRRGIHELGVFEDVVQEGAVRPGLAALWFSEAADVWDDHRAPFDAAERALYLALRHRQLPLDVVVEGDALKEYRVLYLADRHVSRAASAAIAKWVEAGGRLVATAGAGMLDELDAPNVILRKLLGVEPGALELDDANLVRLEKQDLPFVTAMDRVHQGDVTLPVLSARQRLATTKDTTVLATFDDGSPAIVERKVGKGLARTLGFLPGLAYLKPAIPRRPVDRGATDDAMAHLLPTAVDERAASLLVFDDLVLPVTASAKFVETSVVESPKGTVIPLVNWSGAPVHGLTVTVELSIPTHEATLASGKPVKLGGDAQHRTFTLDLDVADALILR